MELDELVGELRAIRDEAGQPSFGDIALGVSRVRRERGMTLEQARVGRTTVYDAFRLGRSRLDADLVADIVRALGGSDAEADAIIARCRASQSAPRVALERVPASVSVSVPVSVQEPVPVDVVAEPRERLAIPGRTLMTVIAISLALNLAGLSLSEWLDLPVYLDMLGTAFSAIALGPWWGVLVAVTTNVAGVAASGPDSLLFAPVNVVGALVWGYGVRRWRLGRSIPRFFALNVVVAVACTVLAVVVIAGLLGGFSESGADEITLSVLAIVDNLWAAVIVSNLCTSVPDKLLAGFVSLTLIEALPPSLRALRPDAWLASARGPEIAVRDCSGSPKRA